MGDLDGRRYPLCNISSSHLRMATCRLGSSGYTLQLMVSGASGLSTMAWSHGHEGGNRWASSSLNTLAWRWYSFGISVILWYCPAVIASSVAVVRAIVVRSWWWCGWIVQRTIGSEETSMVAVPQVMGGSNIASQGYPKIMSSPPRSVTKKHMSLHLFLVCTSRLI